MSLKNWHDSKKAKQLRKGKRVVGVSGAMVPVALGPPSPSRSELLEVLDSAGSALIWLLGRTVAVDHAETARVQECRAVAARVKNALAKAGR